MATVIMKMAETDEEVPVKPGDTINNKMVRRIRIHGGDEADLAVLVFDDGTESEPGEVIRVLY
jgi:hypothetical protein